MREAWELQRFLRSSEDELAWIREADTLLSSEDIGRDLQSVRFLLKIHQVGEWVYIHHIGTSMMISTHGVCDVCVLNN